MNSPIFYIVLGSIIIGVGGWMTTYGWNLQSSNENRAAMVAARQSEIQDARNAMLHTLASEFTMNVNILNDVKYTEKSDEKLKELVVYPRLRTEALAASLASSLFTADSDRELFTRITNLHEKLSDFNYRLNLTQTTMMSKGGIPELRKGIRDGIATSEARSTLKGFGTFLVTHEKIDPNASFFVDLPK